jgi:hypothetical protein
MMDFSASAGQQQPHHTQYQQHMVLLTHLPEHLRDVKSLREVVGICGTSRFASVNGSTGLVRMMTATGVSNVIKNFPVAVEGGVRAYALQRGRLLSSSSIIAATNSTNVHTLTSGSGTLNVEAPLMVTQITREQDGVYDEQLQQQQTPQERPMVRKLLDAIRRLEDRNLQPDVPNGDNVWDKTATETTAVIDMSNNEQQNGTLVPQTTEKELYDEDGDPLNSPQVLEAVKKFKAALEARDIEIKEKRMKMIDKLLEDRTQFHRERIQLERRQQEQQTIQALPYPNETILPPPPSMTLESENVKAGGGLAVIDSGRRGVSNLPSWMTIATAGMGKAFVKEGDELENSEKKRKYESDENDVVGDHRRLKLDLEGVMSQQPNLAVSSDKWDQSTVESMSKEELFAAPVAWDDKLHSLGTSFAQELRKWVAEKIVEYLGEEEATLIDFVMDQVFNKRCAPQQILDEMEMVLDEAAEDFVIQLWCILLVPSSLLNSVKNS